MKTTQLLGIALLAISLGLSGCGEIETPVEPTPDPKPEEIKSEITIDADIITNGLSFTSATGEKSISFTTNEDWTLSIATTQNGDAWCSASTTSGTKGNVNVKFSVTENTSYDDRSVSVTIKSGTASKTFTITQKYAEALLLTTNKYELSQEGGTIEIEVKANIDYEMEIAESAKDWITEATTRALSTYKHSLNIATNEEVENREGEIYFKSGDKVETVKVYQTGGALILLSKDEYAVSAHGETISVDIRSNVEFGVQMPDVDWITDESSTRSMSSHTLRYIIVPNEKYESRTAEIIFYDKNSELKDTLKVVQAQKDAIVISQKTYEVGAEGGTIEVQLAANVDFKVTMPEADWIEMIETRTLHQHTIYFKVAENPDILNRTANVVFTNKDNTTSDTISIKQLNDSGNYKIQGTSTGLYGIVELYKAGALKQLLEIYHKLGDNTQLTKLTITGPINGDDIKTLNMVNSSSSKFEIDLLDADIVEGGQSYYSYSKDFHRIECFTKNNEIGNYMFAESKAVIINLPQSATKIGDYAFYKSRLVTLRTGNGVSSISDHAFSKASFLRNIYIGEGVTSINKRVFQDCSSLLFLDISIGAPSIADYAFAEIPVSRIHIGNNVTSIGEGAFLRCPYLDEVEIPDNVTSIGSRAFMSCENLKSVTIGNGVATIGYEAFWLCEALNSITIGNGVTLIGHEAFAGCKSLNSITIPDSVTDIWYGAFRGCSSLRSVTIGDNVEAIDNRTFRDCTSLESIVIPDRVSSIGDYSFDECSSLKSITIGNNVKTIGESAFSGCNSIESIVIPDSVTSIKKGAFSGCSSMTTLTVGNGINSIEENVFKNCDALSSVYIKDLSAWCNINFKGVSSDYSDIPYSTPLHKGAKLYLNNNELTELVIPDDVKIIGGCAFYGCPSITSVTIGDGVTEIGWYAFRKCPSLTSATIGNNITVVERGAFADCTSLNKVSFGESVKKIEEIAFRNASIKECYSYNPTPPSILYTEPGWSSNEYCTFDHAIIEGAVLYVPKGSRGKYRQSRWDDYFYYYDEWNNKYSNVREME